MTVEERATESRKRVEAVKRLSPSDFAVWKHYEDRADQLGGELWNVGTFLSGLIGGTLALPFVAGFIATTTGYPYVQITNRVGVGVVAVFGLVLCSYAYSAVSDVREHIERNWQKAGFALGESSESETDWGRKEHGWNALMAIDGLSALGFVTMFVGALFWPG